MDRHPSFQVIDFATGLTKARVWDPLNGCIQVHVTELSQTARGAAASLHSSFFYLGQAVGPVVYGYGFAHGGPEPSIFVGAAVVMTVGIACSRLLRHRTSY